MALAWMHSGGAYQMAGYTAVTFFGYGGWGIRDYFIGQADRFTFAEAFTANQLALVHQLQTRYPKNTGVNIDEFDIESAPELEKQLRQRTGITDDNEFGLLWDRDTVAFYGDPAWEARMVKTREQAWTQKLSERHGTWTLEITTNTKGNWGGRPVVQFLPYRLKNVRILNGADLQPVITDNFILVPLSGEFEKDKRLKVVFTAKKIRPGSSF